MLRVSLLCGVCCLDHTELWPPSNLCIDALLRNNSVVGKPAQESVRELGSRHGVDSRKQLLKFH